MYFCIAIPTGSISKLTSSTSVEVLQSWEGLGLWLIHSHAIIGNCANLWKAFLRSKLILEGLGATILYRISVLAACRLATNTASLVT